MLSHPKGGGSTRDRGDVWGDSFQGGPGCSPSSNSGVKGEGGTAIESKNDSGKKERSARGGIAEENAGTCFEKWTGSTYLVKTVAMPAMHSGD